MPVIVFVPTELEAKGIFGGDLTNYEGFKSVTFNGNPIILTGVGKTNAALTLARYFHKFPPQAGTVPLIIGTAGTYVSSLNIGEVVMVKKAYFADEAIVTGKELKLSSEIGFPVCEGNVFECRTVDLGYKICDENTVSLISGTRELSDYYHKKTGAWIESMEGAAFEQAAELFGLKSIQLRAISNPTADPDFVLHTKDAFKNLKEAVLRIMELFK